MNTSSLGASACWTRHPSCAASRPTRCPRCSPPPRLTTPAAGLLIWTPNRTVILMAHDGQGAPLHGLALRPSEAHLPGLKPRAPSFSAPAPTPAPGSKGSVLPLHPGPGGWLGGPVARCAGARKSIIVRLHCQRRSAVSGSAEPHSRTWWGPGRLDTGFYGHGGVLISWHHFSWLS